MKDGRDEELTRHDHGILGDIPTLTSKLRKSDYQQSDETLGVGLLIPLITGTVPFRKTAQRIME